MYFLRLPANVRVPFGFRCNPPMFKQFSVILRLSIKSQLFPQSCKILLTFAILPFRALSSLLITQNMAILTIGSSFLIPSTTFPILVLICLGLSRCTLLVPECMMIWLGLSRTTRQHDVSVFYLLKQSFFTFVWFGQPMEVFPVLCSIEG